MKNLYTIFLILVTILSVFISLSSFLVTTGLPSQVFRLLLLPTSFFLIFKLTNHLAFHTPVFQNSQGWTRVLTTYCFIVLSILAIAGLMSSQFPHQFIPSLVFAAPAVYFLILSWPHRNWATDSFTSHRPIPPPLSVKLDDNRRDFLKMVGAASLSVLLFNLFSKKTTGLPLLIPQGSGGTQPATGTESATSGYHISQIDESDTAYFGFTNNVGQWYIMREETDHSYRYSQGDRDFTINWASRTALKYGYFENVF